MSNLLEDNEGFSIDSEEVFKDVLKPLKSNPKDNVLVFKDEVMLTCLELPKALLRVENMSINKVGRVIEVIDADTVLVDFWDTKPTKIYIKSNLLKVVLPASEVIKMSAEYVAPEPLIRYSLPTITPISNNVTSITTPLKMDSGKERVDLINPNFILEIGNVLGYGALKYPNGDYNYLEGEGLDYSRVYASLNRHILKWYAGESVDPETNMHHLIHAAANLQFLYNYETMHKGKDNRRFKK